MMKPVTVIFLSAAVLSYGAVLHAGEIEFLKSMNGSWEREWYDQNPRQLSANERRL